MTIFLLIIGSSFGFSSGLHAQIWGLANKTHRSTRIIPVEKRAVFSVSNHLFFSSDLGQSFTVDDGNATTAITGFAIGSIGMFYFSSPQGLFSSPSFNDLNNENWIRIDSVNVPSITSLFVRAAPGIAAADEIFIGTTAGLWRRNSNGKTWVQVHNAGDGVPILQIAAFNKSIYYRTHTTAFASHDEGSTWASIATNVTNGTKTAIVATSDTDVYLAVSGNPNSLVLHSTDGGDSFNGQKGTNFSSRTIKALVAGDNGDLYLGGGVRSDINPDSITQAFLFRFLNNGFGWEDFSAGLPSGIPSPEVVGLGFGSGGNVFAGTDSAGLWRTLLPSAVPRTSAQSGITLSQNFPNPAHSFTEFSVTADHSFKASLAVFDALGRTVLKISNGEITQGMHFFRIETQSLTNGTYYYRLLSPEITWSRSFVVSK